MTNIDYVNNHSTEQKILFEGVDSFRLLVEGVRDYGIFMLDPNGYIQTWNAGAERIKGYFSEEIIGRHFSIFYTPDSILQGHPSHELAIAAKEGRYEEENWRVRKDGSRFWANVIITRILDNSGKLIGFSKVTRDLTERKMAEEALQQANIDLERRVELRTAALAASEEYFRTLADSIPQLVWVANPDGFIFWYNKRWYDFTGTTPDQMKGWGWKSVHDPKDLPRILERWLESIAIGSPFEMTFRLKGADGNFRWFITRVVPVKDDGGNVTRWFGTNTDITDTKESELRLKNTQERLDIATNSAQVGLSEWNIASDEVTCSMVTAKLCGFSDATRSIPMQEFFKIIHPDDRLKRKENLERALSGNGDDNDEFRVIWPDGSVHWLAGRGRPIYDPETQQPVRLVGALFDITAQKNIQTVLTESLLARDEFISIASHELKTPITALRFQFELMERSLKKTNKVEPERLSKLMDMSMRQLEKQTRLIEDMLDVSRILTRNFSIHQVPVNLVTIIHEAIQSVSGELDKAGCKVTVFEYQEIWVSADQGRLEQVLTNCLTNVVKYAPGKPVEITLSASEDRAIVRVKDHGNGITQADHKRIFNRFERAVPASDTSGLGLGLYISSQIMKLHQGEITLECSSGSGSTFVMSLPRLVGYAAH